MQKSKALPIEPQAEVKSKEAIPIATNIKTKTTDTTGTATSKTPSKTTDTTDKAPAKATNATGTATGKATTKTTDTTGTTKTPKKTADTTGKATTKTTGAAANTTRKKKEDKSSGGFFSRFKKKLKEPDKPSVTVDDPSSINATTPTDQDDAVIDTEFENIELPRKFISNVTGCKYIYTLTQLLVLTWKRKILRKSYSSKQLATQKKMNMQNFLQRLVTTDHTLLLISCMIILNFIHCSISLII